MKQDQEPNIAATKAQASAWAEELEAMFALIQQRFPRDEPRQHALAYLKGLLSPIERKNGWQLAEAAGDTTPYAIQHLCGRAQWSADEVRDDLQQYVIEHLGDKQAILIIDETGFLKKGDKSAGVQRQYSGTAGRIENCQIGVFLAYASKQGRTFLDRKLYLPQQWAENAERCHAAGVPAAVKFATKPQSGSRRVAVEFDAEFLYDSIHGQFRAFPVCLTGARVNSGSAIPARHLSRLRIYIV